LESWDGNEAITNGSFILGWAYHEWLSDKCMAGKLRRVSQSLYSNAPFNTFLLNKNKVEAHKTNSINEKIASRMYVAPQLDHEER
jgi:hypothetical protein